MPAITGISGPSNINLQVGQAATLYWTVFNAYALAGPWVLSGSVPAGMTFTTVTGNDYAVALTGTPTTPGISTLTLKWTDGIQGDKTFIATVEITAALATVTLLPDPMYQATVGTALAWTCNALLYPAPSPTGFAWSVSGSLPLGVTGAAAGDNSSYTLSGTPTTAGTYTFTLICQETTSGTSRGDRITVNLTVGTTSPTPVQYDPYSGLALSTTHLGANWNECGDLGPFESGTALYVVTDGGLAQSLDGGVTWSTISSGYYTNGHQPAFFAASATKLFCLYYQYPDWQLVLDTFDLETGAWIENVVGILPVTVPPHPSVDLSQAVIVRPDGTVRVFAGVHDATNAVTVTIGDYAPGGGNPTPHVAYSATAVTFLNLSQSVYAHSDGGTTLIFTLQTGSPVVFKSLYVSPAGVGSAPVDIPGITAVGECFDAGVPTFLDGTLYVPIRNNGVSNYDLYVAKASGDLTAPIWTLDLLTDTQNAEWSTSFVVDGEVHVFSTLGALGAYQTALQVGDWTVTASGHTGPAIAYDYKDNPPEFSGTIPTASQFLHILGGRLLPDGRYGFVVGMETDDGCTSVTWIGAYATPAGPSSVIPPAAAPFVFFNDECIVRLVSWGGSVTDVKPFVHVGIDVEP